ncbi:hypothetical protein [Novipirellula rosea]|uniref:Uncharacterized protein n=1 Tax=Novipirellula rosea TaxID=1031540 RepID=A0ABP8NDD3_9BACT
MQSMKELQRVRITKAILGIVHMQVCAVDDATDEEILEFCNRNNSSDDHSVWKKVIREGSEGPFSPTKCKDYEGRTHFVVGS